MATIATDAHHELQEFRASVGAREIRPDWDLSAPGLREAWDADDLTRFHGWDRRAAQSET
jgi:hypothetical protein